MAEPGHGVALATGELVLVPGTRSLSLLARDLARLAEAKVAGVAATHGVDAAAHGYRREPSSGEDPREWARESHVIACLFAYPVRPHPTEAEVVTLTPDYVHSAHEIACERIAIAGYRLAELLDQLFNK